MFEYELLLLLVTTTCIMYFISKKEPKDTKKDKYQISNSRFRKVKKITKDQILYESIKNGRPYIGYRIYTRFVPMEISKKFQVIQNITNQTQSQSKNNNKDDMRQSYPIFEFYSIERLKYFDVRINEVILFSPIIVSNNTIALQSHISLIEEKQKFINESINETFQPIQFPGFSLKHLIPNHFYKPGHNDNFNGNCIFEMDNETIYLTKEEEKLLRINNKIDNINILENCMGLLKSLSHLFMSRFSFHNLFFFVLKFFADVCKTGIIFQLFQNIPLTIKIYDFILAHDTSDDRRVKCLEYLISTFNIFISPQQTYHYFIELEKMAKDGNSYACLLLFIFCRLPPHMDYNFNEYLKIGSKDPNIYLFKAFHGADEKIISSQKERDKCIMEGINLGIENHDKYSFFIKFLFCAEKDSNYSQQFLETSLDLNCDIAFLGVVSFEKEISKFAKYTKKYMKRGNLLAFTIYMDMLKEGTYFSRSEEKAKRIEKMLLKCGCTKDCQGQNLGTSSYRNENQEISILNPFIDFLIQIFDKLIRILTTCKNYLISRKKVQKVAKRSVERYNKKCD
ncbi:hypothetical protein TRFO_19051 [Tritrichomonas foetus]|uniref:Uncharacterized protein n=1 Tax=Tritrichomonas foetus TaxID=1144522 RepID=A0A1J4KJV2_9EUKA|nr:hypothetical protein TRFO_19051 [Tritrichomonas foetus]|eukprot:OHT11507.1 hypothetical protein TRFO_19051 [Tritrichomonas foetus]